MHFKKSSILSVLSILFILSVVAALSVWAAAIKEGYVTRASPATNTAEVFFPQNPEKRIRLVSYDVAGDTNTATLTILSGTQPITITGIINATNLVCVANTNVQTNAVVIVQRADDTIFSLTVLYTNQFTNIFISATNSAVSLATNDVLWICTNLTTTLITSNTLRQAGECLFATQRRAPLALRIVPSGVNANKVNATAKYDDN